MANHNVDKTTVPVRLFYLKRYHRLHHFKTPEKRFGVSNPLWDIVFRTKPEDE